uniref:Uncharacterized protein n=1 Tax=Solanum lycopersicum TaxID=4081 RepID=K4BJR6_SOLLC
MVNGYKQIVDTIMIQASMNPFSNCHENSLTLQENQVKRHRKHILTTYSRKRNKKKDVSKDAGVDPPISGLVPTEEIEINMDDANIPIVNSISIEETEIDMELSVESEFCVTGYHGKLPLAVLMGKKRLRTISSMNP